MVSSAQLHTSMHECMKYKGSDRTRPQVTFFKKSLCNELMKEFSCFSPNLYGKIKKMNKNPSCNFGLCCSTGISVKNLKSQYVIIPMNFSSNYKFENIICFVCSTVPC